VGRVGRRTQTHPLAMRRDPANTYAAKAFAQTRSASKARRSLWGHDLSRPLRSPGNPADEVSRRVTRSYGRREGRSWDAQGGPSSGGLVRRPRLHLDHSDAQHARLLISIPWNDRLGRFAAGEELEGFLQRVADDAVEQHSGVLRLSRPRDKCLARTLQPYSSSLSSIPQAVAAAKIAGRIPELSRWSIPFPSPIVFVLLNARTPFGPATPIPSAKYNGWPDAA
jgi:hypothetical protein